MHQRYKSTVESRGGVWLCYFQFMIWHENHISSGQTSRTNYVYYITNPLSETPHWRNLVRVQFSVVLVMIILLNYLWSNNCYQKQHVVRSPKFKLVCFASSLVSSSFKCGAVLPTLISSFDIQTSTGLLHTYTCTTDTGMLPDNLVTKFPYTISESYLPIRSWAQHNLPCIHRIRLC